MSPLKWIQRLATRLATQKEAPFDAPHYHQPDDILPESTFFSQYPIEDCPLEPLDKGDKVDHLSNCHWLPLICTYLEASDVVRCMRVNRRFYGVITENWSLMKKRTMQIKISFNCDNTVVDFKSMKGLTQRTFSVSLTSSTITIHEAHLRVWEGLFPNGKGFRNYREREFRIQDELNELRRLLLYFLYRFDIITLTLDEFPYKQVRSDECRHMISECLRLIPPPNHQLRIESGFSKANNNLCDFWLKCPLQPGPLEFSLLPFTLCLKRENALFYLRQLLEDWYNDRRSVAHFSAHWNKFDYTNSSLFELMTGMDVDVLNNYARHLEAVVTRTSDGTSVKLKNHNGTITMEPHVVQTMWERM